MHIQAKLGQENLLRMVRYTRCEPDTRPEALEGKHNIFFLILSITDCTHNISNKSDSFQILFYFENAEFRNLTAVHSSGLNSKLKVTRSKCSNHDCVIC